MTSICSIVDTRFVRGRECPCSAQGVDGKLKEHMLKFTYRSSFRSNQLSMQDKPSSKGLFTCHSGKECFSQHEYFQIPMQKNL